MSPLQAICIDSSSLVYGRQDGVAIRSLYEPLGATPVSTNPTADYIAESFFEHFQIWRNETRFLSNIESKQAHPSYKAIIKMGHAVIPMIISDMKAGGCFWSKALTKITGEDPVPDEAVGDCETIAKYWIRWYEHQ